MRWTPDWKRNKTKIRHILGTDEYPPRSRPSTISLSLSHLSIKQKPSAIPSFHVVFHFYMISLFPFLSHSIIIVGFFSAQTQTPFSSFSSSLWIIQEALQHQTRLHKAQTAPSLYSFQRAKTVSSNSLIKRIHTKNTNTNSEFHCFFFFLYSRGCS